MYKIIKKGTNPKNTWDWVIERIIKKIEPEMYDFGVKKIAFYAGN